MNEALYSVAKRVNWYTPPDTLLDDKRRFLCEIMARGTVEDVLIARQAYSKADFQDAYETSPPGLFDERSWAYWGLILFSDPGGHPYPVRFPESEPFDWRG